MNYYFYDTSSLLALEEKPEHEIALSSITLSELEEIKQSKAKDNKIKYRARKLLRDIDKNPDNYYIHIYNENMLDVIKDKGIILNNDSKILATAIDYDNRCHPDETIFVTNDLCLKYTANLFFGNDSIMSIYPKEKEKYVGYKEVVMNEQEMSDFYSNLTFNKYDLFINEYLIIKEESGKIVDKVCWTGDIHRPVIYTQFESPEFGMIKPYQGDDYQAIAMDSIVKNKVTMINGPAGSGKTMLAFGYLFSQLHKGKIDRIVIFCNPVTVKNAAQLGLYPGTQLEKLLQTQAGSILTSKLGSEIAVQQLLQQEKLVIVPACDARGYQTPEHSGVYIMESQNLTSDLLRLLLQRIGEDTKVIVDGDFEEQVDLDAYAEDNGMQKMSDVFKGSELYGQVELPLIHRSKIAQLADQMK